MEYGETSFHDIAANLLCVAIYIGAIGLCRIPEHAFFLAIGLGLVEFRVFVR
jgi:hypothetical protein